MVLLYCAAHPEYMAKRKPQAECRGCWKLYLVMHDLRDDATANPSDLTITYKEKA